ncbi:MAG: hypothetical protein KBS47_05585, partial [Bacteroidales bacterium]|nr:hypothetical protein [Candidatus Equimonas enterica]
NTSAKFFINAAAGDYAIGYALTEDGLKDAQTNGYSGANAAAYTQTFGSEPSAEISAFFQQRSPYVCTYNGVARKIYGVKGIEESVGAVAGEGQVVYFNITLDVPANVKDINNSHLITLVYDTETGEVVQAMKQKIGENNLIEMPKDTYYIVLTNAPSNASVTLDGQAFTADGTYAVAKELTLDALVVAEVEGYDAEKTYDADTHTFTVAYTFKNAAAIAALRSLVADAQSLYDNSTEGTEYGQYASGSRAALLEVLNAVNENITDTMSTASIDSCTAMINAAVAEFESHKETKVADTDISTLSNAIYIEPFDAFCGSTAEVVVKMKNTIAPTGFQFNMYLPDGVSVVEDADGFCDVTLSTTRTTPQKTNTFDASIVSDGSLMVLAASTKNYAFTGTDGEVVRINLDIDKELEEGEYPIILRNIELTDDSGTPYRVPYLKTTMTANAYKIGDVNADGTVSVADFSAIASHILENTPAGFVAKAADVNEDGFVSVSDLSSLVPIIIAESTGGNSFHARKSLRFKAKTNISDKDNIIYADDVFVSPGKDFTVTFNMRNLSTAMTGFQFNMTLPDGITVCKDADGFLEANLSTARTTAAKTNTFDASIVSDGTLMVLAASTKNYKFEGSDGEVVTVKMHAADDLAVGTYDLAIDRIELTDDKGTPFRPGEPIVSTISVTAPLQLATADFDFTDPASLGITPATNVDDAVEITAPITKGAVTATLEGGVEATIDADMYLLNIDKGGSLVLTATEPYKIVKVEFGGDELADISKLSATTGEFEAGVWTGEADEVTFNVANTFRASANVTTIKVWLSGGAPSGDLTFT